MGLSLWFATAEGCFSNTESAGETFWPLPVPSKSRPQFSVLSPKSSGFGVLLRYKLQRDKHATGLCQYEQTKHRLVMQVRKHTQVDISDPRAHMVRAGAGLRCRHSAVKTVQADRI